MVNVVVKIIIHRFQAMKRETVMGTSSYAQLSYPIALLNARNVARTMIFVTRIVEQTTYGIKIPTTFPCIGVSLVK